MADSNTAQPTFGVCAYQYMRCTYYHSYFINLQHVHIISTILNVEISVIV